MKAVFVEILFAEVGSEEVGTFVGTLAFRRMFSGFWFSFSVLFFVVRTRVGFDRSVSKSRDVVHGV